MRLLIFCISAFFLIVVTAGPTLAEEPFTVLGVYQTRGDVMGVVVATDLKHKAAVFAVDVARLNKPKVRLTLGFGDAEDWQQFAQIWLKARRTTPPREGFGTEIGHYFSVGLNTGITVSVHKDGVITFALAGKPEGDLVACLIDIEPKDFGRFDETVKKLTDYFKD
jgi:hypothetical protein